MQDHVKHIDILPAVCTDHSAIILSFVPIVKRGPSYWKFNNSLLKDNNFIDQMKERIESILSNNTFAEDPRVNWDFLKYKMNEFSRNYSIAKKHRNTAEKFELEAKLKSLSKLISSNCSNEVRKEYEECQNKLELIYENIVNGAIIRSRIDWYDKGEKSNKYFFNLEKRNKSKTHLSCLIEIIK